MHVYVQARISAKLSTVPAVSFIQFPLPQRISFQRHVDESYLDSNEPPLLSLFPPLLSWKARLLLRVPFARVFLLRVILRERTGQKFGGAARSAHFVLLTARALADVLNCPAETFIGRENNNPLYLSFCSGPFCNLVSTELTADKLVVSYNGWMFVFGKYMRSSGWCVIKDCYFLLN